MCQLVIDIGNSRVKYGVFSHDMLVAQAVKDTLTSEDILQLLTNHPIENIIYSSVAASESRLLSENMTAQVPVMELKADTPLPIDNEYGTPATLGKDRLAAAVGAASQYAGHH
ncbi:MAG: type III pantothenate kinase [Saprospiraceae bacterium]